MAVKTAFQIGDRVTLMPRKTGEYDGTVVDVVDDDLVRVYWRLYQGRVGRAGVKDHYNDHLRRVV
jgi:hypothetical protein